MDDEIECIAKAFYALQDGVRGWDREPERLKEAFRQDARATLALIDAEIEARRQACNCSTV
ncbi:hypothetical protein [Microvirga sp. VF16]|uniref:hypothetical protein n=1 Tax=Microvirga sp. VF16 TaxID=2807101 RepID=UPI00193E13C0|nr:hypothetical protein [Microvirga sp. VF16]QRM34112.1 hypothetical protein JO965_33145 [Microvirga sp. VF16]